MHTYQTFFVHIIFIDQLLISHEMEYFLGKKSPKRIIFE